MSSVAVIDYGMGNLHSIAKALQHIPANPDVTVSDDPKRIMQADRIVLPGVGAIGDCMAALKTTRLDEVVREAAQHKPLLGICIGLQIMLDESEESGTTQCLGIFPGRVSKFPENNVDDNGDKLKIPHMGWNTVTQQHHPLWDNIPDNSRFYFVHSYHARPEQSEHCVGTSCYPYEFSCALAKDNIFAVQFHPEKSQRYGLQLLENFIHWDGQS
ncbi:MAG: imidazole glycerol phosphate synthase subunit HisH [Gammaproteobacteria bacterium]|nr:imidazole glycerol phosphate synthase subunit HisH [Gammaproteobacteria bacterium]